MGGGLEGDPWGPFQLYGSMNSMYIAVGSLDKDFLDVPGEIPESDVDGWWSHILYFLMPNLGATHTDLPCPQLCILWQHPG